MLRGESRWNRRVRGHGQRRGRRRGQRRAARIAGHEVLRAGVRDQMVPRDRLLERLRGGSGHGLSLVVSPAGCGKTTLLAAWREVEASRRPVGWLTLDDGDDDPVVLWSYVIEAVRRVHPGDGESGLTAVVAAASIVDVVLPRWVNELAEQGDTVLILDDYHRLSDRTRRPVGGAHTVSCSRSAPMISVSPRRRPTPSSTALRLRSGINPADFFGTHLGESRRR